MSPARRPVAVQLNWSEDAAHAPVPLRTPHARVRNRASPVQIGATDWNAIRKLAVEETFSLSCVRRFSATLETPTTLILRQDRRRVLRYRPKAFRRASLEADPSALCSRIVPVLRKLKPESATA